MHEMNYLAPFPPFISNSFRILEMLIGQFVISYIHADFLELSTEILKYISLFFEQPIAGHSVYMCIRVLISP